MIIRSGQTVQRRIEALGIIQCLKDFFKTRHMQAPVVELVNELLCCPLPEIIGNLFHKGFVTLEHVFCRVHCYHLLFLTNSIIDILNRPINRVLNYHSSMGQEDSCNWIFAGNTQPQAVHVSSVVFLASQVLQISRRTCLTSAVTNLRLPVTKSFATLKILYVMKVVPKHNFNKKKEEL